MSMAGPNPSGSPTAQLRYMEQRAPIHFPESAKVPETQLHLDLRTLLYHLLQAALGRAATVGSDQFMYFDAEDPRQVLTPDVYVRRTPRANASALGRVGNAAPPR